MSDITTKAAARAMALEAAKEVACAVAKQPDGKPISAALHAACAVLLAGEVVGMAERKGRLMTPEEMDADRLGLEMLRSVGFKPEPESELTRAWWLIGLPHFARILGTTAPEISGLHLTQPPAPQKRGVVQRFLSRWLPGKP